MSLNLTTINVLLGIMAAVSLLKVVALIAVPFAGFLVVRRILRTGRGFKTRQIDPTLARLEAIRDDVRSAATTMTKLYAASRSCLQHVVEELFKRR